jgi:hypothetical protein
MQNYLALRTTLCDLPLDYSLSTISRMAFIPIKRNPVR